KQIAVEAMRDIVIDYTVGWYGVTEADLLGEGIGSSDPVTFSRELFAVVIADHSDWVGLAFDRLLKLANDRFKERQEAEKN
ncbi:hypothetical protein, partial [Roseateles sp.]|uniref:hypothetical protein n=1 Tax=Roseateles sp. TaxID=1971397 RepID=UPI002F3F1018